MKDEKRSVPGKKRAHRIRKIALIVGVWILVIECAAQLLVRWKPEWTHPAKAWLHADALNGYDWIEPYFSEWWESYSVDWKSYVYWRRRPYTGEFINIDERGVRKTWRGETPGSNETPIRIFMFGGSTLWGFGARDENTIPSHLAKRISTASGKPVEVTNYGETGYVSTQEMIALLRLLQAGNIPDVAIFYDGNNDVFSAYQSHAAGLPQNEYRRRKEFNLLRVRGEKTGYLAGAAAYHTVMHSAALQLFQATMRSIGPPRMVGSGAPVMPVEVSRDLGNQVAKIYEGNVRILDALAREYGFALYCFWQPTVFDKPSRSTFEQMQESDFSYLRDFNVEAARALKETGDERIILLSDVFESTREPIFIDFCHVSEKGNGMIAEAMLPYVLPALGPDPSIIP